MESLPGYDDWKLRSPYDELDFEDEREIVADQSFDSARDAQLCEKGQG